MPWSTCAKCLDVSRPACSVRRARSRAMICETFATESLGKPVALAGKSALPGAPAQTMLLVRGTHTTVAIRLRFRGFPCTITTGRRNPGPDPAGSGKSAHQTSPWVTSTTRHPSVRAVPRERRTDRIQTLRVAGRPRSCLRLPRPGHDARGTRTALPHRADSEISGSASHIARHHGTRDQGATLLFSYQ
jgi:hypothetical protein